MSDESRPPSRIPDSLRARLKEGDISFREFVERCLYDPAHGYYTAASKKRDRHRDFITAPAISPLFAWTIARWFRERLLDEIDDECAVVDVGCGDGVLLESLAEFLSDAGERARAPRFIGIDRSLSFVPEERRTASRVEFSTSLDAIPVDRAVLVICNELFDALPFARVVQRESGLSELFVTLAGESLDWSERPAEKELIDYLEMRGANLAVGQFADITPDWGGLYADVAGRIGSGVILTLDYGYDTKRFFDNRARRFGTAAAYQGHQVHRDLLANPGRQDLTCHVNFDDLIEAGEGAGLETLAFTRLARFLVEAGGAEYPIFAEETPEGLENALDQRQEKENARRLLLPDGIGDEMRVLVQEKGRVLSSRGYEEV